MPAKVKNMLSGIVAKMAMRRQVKQLPGETSISDSINILIKYKINGLLAIDDSGKPVGVLSKTDIMGAYYAGLPIDLPLADIMSRPPLYCYPETFLEEALETMRDKGIYRLYVLDPQYHTVVGALAYPDIVGLLYRYCRDCEYSQHQQRNHRVKDTIKRIQVKTIMTCGVKSVQIDDSLSQVIEQLSMYRFGAILVQGKDETPVGVISKTDLVLAYKHGIDPGAPAAAIMSSPVQCCGEGELLEKGIRRMIFSDIHRLFVHGESSNSFVGVFSLSDAARSTSGSCHACISSRIRMDT